MKTAEVVCIGVLGFAFACSVSAAETTWIGPASGGGWHDAANWDNGVPGPDSDVNIEVADGMTISPASGKPAHARRLRVTGAGTLNIPHTGNGLYFGKDADGACVVDVAEGVTVSADTTFQSASANLAPHFVKTGAGTLNVGNGTANRGFGSNRNWGFAGVDVAEGVLGVHYGNTDSDSFNPGAPAIIHVAAGAKLDANSRNWLVNWGRIDVAEGGLADFHGGGDFIGGFSGAGVVTNISNNINLSLKDGPYVFTGRIHGWGTLTMRPEVAIASSNSTAAVAATLDEAHFVVGPRTLADLNAVTSTLTDYPEVLQFAPGYPVGTVFEVKRFNHPASCPLLLQDAEGQPVAVRADVRFGSNGPATPVAGPGTLIHPFESMYTTGTLLANTGDLVVESGSVQLGAAPDATRDAVVSARSLHVEAGAVLAANNVAPLTLPRVTGGGIVNFTSASDEPDGNVLTFSEFSMTNGQFYSSHRFPRYVIDGGVATNVMLNQNESTGMVVTINGGFLHVNGGSMSGEAERQFIQTGGHVVTEMPLSGWRNTGSNHEIFYRMSGGTCESYTKYNYGRGLGAALSGDAYMKLRRSWPDSRADYQYHRISSDGFSYALTLADNAVLDVDSLNFATGGSTPGYHGTLRLDGGTLRVGMDIYIGYSASGFPAGFDGRVYFNGGLVQSTLTGAAGRDWFNPTAIKGYLGDGGLRFDSALERHSTDFIRLNMPIVRDPACTGVDGGVTKTGRGCLVLHGDMDYQGGTRVTGGAVRDDGAALSTPFGSGAVELDDAGLYVGAARTYSVASGDGAALSYDGVSFLGPYGTAGATINAGPLVRRNKGVLLLTAPANGALAAGTTMTVKTADGMSLAAGGLPVQPVFGYSSAGGYFQCFTFLTYDAEKGFVAAPCVSDLAAAGANDLVQITSEKTTLTADRQIAGLDMRYRNGNVGEQGLVIGAGRTLKIGNDAGYAPVLLNSTSGSGNTPNQSIEGGTLDFGAAEGLVLGGENNCYGWFRANKIRSVIAGTGGVTFAGGLSSARRMDIELYGANTWTGGATIESVCIKPMAPGALSSGTVTVHGSDGMGGGIWVPSESTLAALPNAFVLSGRGCYTASHLSSNVNEGDYGALCVDRSVAVSGPVTLAGDTLVRVRGTGSVLAFGDAVSGPGRLTVRGSGVVRLGADNSYAGGTRVEGVVECATAGALGTGPVEVAAGGQLRFTNTQPITLPNDISGAGEIVFAGTAPVTFAGRTDGLTGAVHGSGALTGATAALVKNADGVAWLTATNTYGGATAVNAGTLVLGVPPAAETLPFADAVTAHVDASAEGTVTSAETDGVAYVSSVRDADGRALTWSNATEGALPQYRADALNGRPALTFDGSRDRLAGTENVRVRTMFAVLRIPSGNHPVGWNCAGFFGKAGADCGVRLSNGRRFADDGWMKFGETWLNGVRTLEVPADTVVVASFLMGTDQTQATGIGNYWGDSRYDRTWWGDIGEIVCYDRLFNADERVAVERHLAAKWGVSLGEGGKLVDVLPAHSPLTVAAGAALDLAGSDQTVTTLAGAGTVMNSSGTPSTLTVQGDALADFTGSLQGGIVLKIVGDATLDPSAVAVDPSVDLVLSAGSILDLGGGTLTVHDVSGSGWVKNGTLVVLGADNRRNPATVIIFR